MEIYRYPLLCWQLRENLICGRLVGTDYELVNTQLSKLQAHLAEHLQRTYTQEMYLPESLPDGRGGDRVDLQDDSMRFGE